VGFGIFSLLSFCAGFFPFFYLLLSCRVVHSGLIFRLFFCFVRDSAALRWIGSEQSKHSPHVYTHATTRTLWFLHFPLTLCESWAEQNHRATGWCVVRCWSCCSCLCGCLYVCVVCVVCVCGMFSFMSLLTVVFLQADEYTLCPVRVRQSVSLLLLLFLSSLLFSSSSPPPPLLCLIFFFFFFFFFWSLSLFTFRLVGISRSLPLDPFPCLTPCTEKTHRWG
jgi:hypothetical protein